MTELAESHFSDLTDEESWELLREHFFGRLAISVSDQPEIFPFNYIVQNGTLVFRTAQGTKLAGLTVNEHVAVEIDGYHVTGGWSVVVKGRARAAEWGEDFELAQTSGLKPWVGTRKQVFVRITPDQVTGRRFLFGPEPDDV